ncbi:MAG: threonine synthase [Burkholderiaceae bacterium]|jgi:threonine synthase|nr:threonine synthase [Burkholderiaceae bacterium]
MQYVSTRGRAPEQGFLGILLSGLASDGGLYLPTHYPQISAEDLAHWRTLDYADLAFELLRRFATDIPVDNLAALCRRTYTAQVYGNGRPDSDATQIAPLRAIEPGVHLLELSNGPTLAFKDMAMQLLGALFEYALAQRGERLNVLGATSGDTGSAAEYAMRGRRGINVFMLSPQGRMSAFQRAQMYSLQDANIFNLAVGGTFDDCQDIVKAVSADLDFKQRLKIGTVNSINWARVVAQVVYYVKGWLAATSRSDERVSFCVPSGNFGNVFAGWVAKRMGLPIDRLIVATNENDVLDEFFRSGRYRVRAGADTHATSSPSMDISKASNFERFVFDIVGRDAEFVRELWWQLDTEGQFDVAGTPIWGKVQASGFASGRSTHADRLRTIRELHAARGLVVDPHTADGLKVARDWRAQGVKTPIICLETALPAKFAETIVEAIGTEPPRPAAYAGIEQQPQRFEPIGVDVEAVKRYITAHAGAAA